jgi:hypothetical protein
MLLQQGEAGCVTLTREKLMQSAIIAITFLVMLTAPCVIAMRVETN